MSDTEIREIVLYREDIIDLHKVLTRDQFVTFFFSYEVLTNGQGAEEIVKLMNK